MKDEDWFNEVVEEYGSLENYLSERIKGRAIPDLKGFKPFEYLLSKKLLEEGMSIRTTDGRCDHHYEITLNGKLNGVEAKVHGGPKGIHDPREKLALAACRFWTIESTNSLNYLLRHSAQKL